MQNKWGVFKNECSVFKVQIMRRRFYLSIYRVEEVELRAALAGPRRPQLVQLTGLRRGGEAVGRAVQQLRAVVELVAL